MKMTKKKNPPKLNEIAVPVKIEISRKIVNEDITPKTWQNWVNLQSNPQEALQTMLETQSKFQAFINIYFGDRNATIVPPNSLH